MEVKSYEAKKENHIQNKKEQIESMGPGMYYDPLNTTCFKYQKRPEYLQFFGSTQDRFKQMNVSDPGLNEIGPGTYDTNKQIIK